MTIANIVTMTLSFCVSLYYWMINTTAQMIVMK